MKLEVEPNMYVRTKKLLHNDYVVITKIKHIEEKENCLHIWLENKDLITEKHIIKASHNIIDLIEVGDYVNGVRVEDIEIVGGNKYIIITINEAIYLLNCQIETIVTKEQFEAMQYKVV